MRRVIVEEPLSQAAVWSLRLSVFALAVAAVAVAGTRFQLVDVPAGLAVFGSAILLDCLALLLAGTAGVIIWRTGRRGLAPMFGGVLIPVPLLFSPAPRGEQALPPRVPTDIPPHTTAPPQFSLSKRATEARNGRNPRVRTTAERQQQRSAYPGVQPILLELEGDDAYQLILRAVQALGWKIIDQSAPGGRAGLGHIDAVARTLVMGFPDDITIRVQPLAGQTKIDVRSVSRYGRNDFGVNARRIERFAEELQTQLDAK